MSWQARLAPASRCRSPHTAQLRTRHSVHGTQYAAQLAHGTKYTAQLTHGTKYTAELTHGTKYTAELTHGTKYTAQLTHSTKYTAQLSGKHRLSHSAPVAGSSLRRTQPRMIKNARKHENMKNFGLEEAKSDTL